MPRPDRTKKNPASDEQEAMQFVVLRRGRETFALRIEDTAEVGLAPPVSPGKTKHAACVGLIELHDERVVLFDVAAAMANAPARGAAPRMFARLRTQPVTAVGADSLQSVLTLLEPATHSHDFVMASIRVGGDSVPVLDVDRVRRAAHGISLLGDLARRLEDLEV